MKRSPTKLITLFCLLLCCILFCINTSCKQKPSGTESDLKVDSLQVSPASSGALFYMRFTPKWHHQAQHAGFYMAKKNGFYEKYGLNVEIIAGEPADTSTVILKRGQTDAFTMFLIAALSNWDKDNQLVNLAQLFQHSTLMLVGKKSRGIDSIQSIKGKKIGLWHTDFQDLSIAFLHKHQLNPQVIVIERTNTLFIHDVVDLINVMYYNEYHWLLMSGIEDDDLFKINFRELDYDIPEDGIYVSREFYEKHPKECEAFAKASLEGWVYAFEHPEETLQEVLRIMKAHYLPTNISQQRWMLEKLRDTIIIEPGQLGYLKQKDFEATKKLLLPNKPYIKDLSYEEFFPGAKNTN